MRGTRQQRMGKCRGRRTRLGLAGFGGSTNSDEEPQQIGETEDEWGKKSEEDIAGRHAPSFFFVCGSGNRDGSGSIHYELNSKTCHVVCGAHDRTDARCSTLRTLLERDTDRWRRVSQQQTAAHSSA